MIVMRRTAIIVVFAIIATMMVGGGTWLNSKPAPATTHFTNSFN
jgi:hypothetical protein